MPGTGSEPRTPQKRTLMAETRRAIRGAHGEGNRTRRPGSPEAWRQNNIARHRRKPAARARLPETGAVTVSVSVSVSVSKPGVTPARKAQLRHTRVGTNAGPTR